MPDFDFKQPIGRGFFGEVWLAYDKAAGELRAVKFISTARLLDPLNFYAEAQTLTSLEHENIVRVKDAGSADTTNTNTYISMEYLAKGSVEARLENGNLTLDEARRFSIDVCWGLEHAHSAGYLHRDIKPGNIMIADDGRGKLSDFGLATRVTPLGTASGFGYTPHCAPEMLVLNVSTVASDIYALGVTIYRMINKLTAAQFHTVDPAIVDRIVRGTFPDRRGYAEWVPDSLRRVVNKAMHPEPSCRFKSASELRHALERIELHFDWARPNAHTWIGQGKSQRCEITVTPARAGWTVQHRRGLLSSALREVRADRATYASDALATKAAQAIVKRITTRGR